MRHLLWNCPDMNVTGPHWWSVNIGSGNGLVPSHNKPLPEPMLTQISVAIWRHQATMSFNTWEVLSYIYHTSQQLCTWFVLYCVLLLFGNSRFHPYPPGLLHWHWGNRMIAPLGQSYDCPIASEVTLEVMGNVPLWREAIGYGWRNHITKQSITQPCSYFMGCTAHKLHVLRILLLPFLLCCFRCRD